MTVSVAMATYNGIVYIQKQVDSILAQLETTDELVISDDGSTDGTREWLEELALRDARVRVLSGPRQGVIKNFETAVTACTGEWIFLADQDDEWMPDKREAVLACAAETDAVLVMHDARVVNEHDAVLADSFFALRGSRTGFVKNLWKNSYIGCCIAFSRQLLPYILPFPDGIPMHDQWIGLQAERHGTTVLLDRPLLHYCRHGDNATAMTHGSLKTMIRSRVAMLRALFRKG